jgi:hypothetical protein
MQYAAHKNILPEFLIGLLSKLAALTPSATFLLGGHSHF